MFFLFIQQNRRAGGGTPCRRQQLEVPGSFRGEGIFHKRMPGIRSA